jgi:multiple sugar transport system ATP-binding protein
MNFGPGIVTKARAGKLAVECFGGQLVQLTGEASPGDAVTVGVRPHHLRRANGRGGISARVELIEALGAETVVHCRTTDDVNLLAVFPGQDSLARGDAIRLEFSPEHTHGFREDGNRLAGN